MFCFHELHFLLGLLMWECTKTTTLFGIPELKPFCIGGKIYKMVNTLSTHPLCLGNISCTA